MEYNGTEFVICPLCRDSIHQPVKSSFHAYTGSTGWGPPKDLSPETVAENIKGLMESKGIQARIEQRSDGFYVVGQGMLCPVDSREEGLLFIADLTLDELGDEPMEEEP